MARGFTFCGTRSVDFGLYFVSTDRQLLPVKRKNELMIAGRDGMYDQGGTTYDMRLLTVDCSFAADTIDDIPGRARRISAWLSQRGELEFDDEPGVFYTAEVVDGVSLTRAMRVGRFTLTFRCAPLAHSVERQADGILTANGDEITVAVSGTAETPCRIILTNIGETTIESLRVSRRRQG